MSSLEESFKTGMVLMSVMLLAGTFETYRPTIESRLVKKLGRKPTNEEWHYFLQECYEKVKVDFQQEQFRQWVQLLADRKAIHDFIWNHEIG